jgi:hypothetical protein
LKSRHPLGVSRHFRTAHPRQDHHTVGLTIAAAGFLGWIIVKSMLQAGAPENWSILGIVGVGVILMFVARFGLRSPFFGIARESSDT